MTLVEFKCECGNEWLLECETPAMLSVQFLVANPCIECGNMPYSAAKRPSKNFYEDRETMNAKDIELAKSWGIKL